MSVGSVSFGACKLISFGLIEIDGRRFDRDVSSRLVTCAA
jgi:hypothetical protein